MRKKKVQESEKAEEAEIEPPTLHHDAPVVVLDQDKQAVPPKTDLPMITVKLAACGLLLQNELKRQKDSGMVEQYGRLRISGKLLKPNEIDVVPKTPEVMKAIKDGWIIDQGITPRD